MNSRGSQNNPNGNRSRENSSQPDAVNKDNSIIIAPSSEDSGVGKNSMEKTNSGNDRDKNRREELKR